MIARRAHGRKVLCVFSLWRAILESVIETRRGPFLGRVSFRTGACRFNRREGNCTIVLPVPGRMHGQDACGIGAMKVGVAATGSPSGFLSRLAVRAPQSRRDHVV